MNFINQLLKNFKKTVYSGFKDIIWGVDLADVQSDITKESSIYCVQLICLANMRGLFL